MPKWKSWLLSGGMLALVGGGMARADDWQRLADLIPHLDYGDFLYNRLGRHVLRELKPKSLEAIESLREMEVDLDQLKQRVKDPDPRIRTLVLMKLYVSGDPQAFRVIQGCLADEAQAIPMSSSFDHGWGPPGPEPAAVRTQPQTVGQIARMMMGMVGFRGNEDFEAWAGPRLDNPDWMGWYEFQLKRVTRGTSPVPDGIDKDLAAFNKLLDARPPALRAWIGFVAADEAMMLPKEDTILGTREELIERGRKLGPEALLGFLADGTRAGLQHPKADDPGKGRRFVLQEARYLFRPEDADKLHEMGHFIAASDVRPEMASTWIREACAKWSPYQGWDRARAMACLLEHQGDKEAKFVADWFYADEPDTTGSTDQSVFITDYRRRRPADWRQSLKALVSHPGFASMDRISLIYLGLMINDSADGMKVEKELLADQRETELRNAIRRCLGVDEVPARWIDLNDKGSEVAARWTAPLEAEVERMAVDSKGEFVAMAMRDGTVRIHRVENGELVGAVAAHDSGVTAIGFRGSDGCLMVVRSRGEVETWIPRTVQAVKSLTLDAFATTDACFGPDGTWLASRQANEVGVSVHDLATGQRRWNLPMRIRAFGLIGVSADGSRIAVGNGFDRRILLFDPAGPELLGSMRGHSGMPRSVAFSSDGTILVSTGEDTKIMVWEARSGQPVAEFACRQKWPRVATCSGDSTSFFFTGGAGKITRVDLLEGRVVQSLTFDGGWSQLMASSRNSVVAAVHTKNGKSMLVGWKLGQE